MTALTFITVTVTGAYTTLWGTTDTLSGHRLANFREAVPPAAGWGEGSCRHSVHPAQPAALTPIADDAENVFNGSGSRGRAGMDTFPDLLPAAACPSAYASTCV